MVWFAEAPANIALIKYMGKTDEETNIPSNSSLSYTLDELKSFVSLTDSTITEDKWEPLDLPGLIEPFQLSEPGQQRFLEHLAFLKEKFQYSGNFVLRSCNNFPTGTGLASSASSFAALTKCAVRALSELNKQEELSVEKTAALSRHGSGSSCRSFFSPWALWEKKGVHAIEIPYEKLLHYVVVVEHGEKAVSSSEAHQRVMTSELYPTRAQRAEENLKTLLDHLEHKNWQGAYEVVWKEFQDMHQLFATASDSFSYMTDASQEILDTIQNFWQKNGDGPLVTMDAGPNVHLLFRPDQADQADYLKKFHFLGNYDVI